MTPQTLRSYHVWDLPTRLFHWINVVCVTALAGIGTAILWDKALGVSDAGKILLKTTHVWFGYVFAANLLFRLVWAFVGNKHARWGAIVPFYSGYWNSLRDYLGKLMRGQPQSYAGHNPAARLMVFVLLLLLTTQAATGLMLAGTDIYYLPFGGWITNWIAAPGTDPASIVPYNMTGVDQVSWEAMRAFRSPILTTHYWVFFAILAAIALHITGVIITEIREGGGIISAMFTGRKVFDTKPDDADDADVQ